MPEEEPKKPPEDPRVRLAGERTLLAWIRTGLAMMGFGFVVARFGMFLREMEAVARAEAQRPAPAAALSLSTWIGTLMILAGVVVLVVAARQHFAFLGRLDRGKPYQRPGWSLGLVTAVGLAALGILMAAYVAFAEHR